MRTRAEVCLNVIAVCLAAVLANGCWSTGSRQLMNETAQSVDTKITDGKSTKADIRAKFGGPKRIEFSESDKEVWRYEFYYEQFEPQNLVNPLVQKTTGTKKELVILYDDFGVVLKHTFADAPFETRSGFLK